MFSFMKNPGILGINARNLLYLKPYNPRKSVKMADDKIKTKHFLSARDIPVPRLYGVINSSDELEKFDFNSLPGQFVLKPNLGFGGEGIIPIVARDKETGDWVKGNGQKLSEDEYKSHIYDILDGRFSVSGVGDIAFFEQLIIPDSTLGEFSYKGLPDIRIIVYNLIPVMAMLRLPTKKSDGKANLHLGAIGCGIDLAKGEVTHITRANKIVDEEIDRDLPGLRGLKIPYWDDMLLIASKIQLIANLGYLAVDLAIDKTMGPVLLEMNARAGLNVQIANLAPLKKRLQQVQGIKVTSPEKGIRVAKDMFGNIVQKEIQQISGKEIIQQKENIELLSVQMPTLIEAKVALYKKITEIDSELAKELKLITHEQYLNEDELKIKLKFQLKKKKISTIAAVTDLSNKKYKFYIGIRDLKGFLIDPSLPAEESGGIPNPIEVIARQKIEDRISELHKTLSKTNYSQVDRELCDIEEQIKLLHHLKPLNLDEEIDKVENDLDYNPVFYYPDLKFNPFDLKKALSGINIEDDTPLGQLFKDKKSEIQNKISLLEHIGTNNFTLCSINLYGKPGKDLLHAAKQELDQIPSSFIEEGKTMSSAQAAEKFEKAFAAYGLKGWRVKLIDNLVSDCLAGKRNVLFIKKSALFSEIRVKTLIAHEIETHIISAENGKNQPYKIFNRGTAGYLTTQEGLAIYNQNRVINRSVEKYYWSISSVLAVDIALNGSFSDVVKGIIKTGIAKERAIRQAIKSKRGLEDTSRPGGFTKDIIYYRGYLEINKFIEKGGDIKALYLGKINIADVSMVKNINGIKEPAHLPNWLKSA